MIVSITNRHLCCEDFYKRIEKIHRSGADKIILREKDLPDEEYYKTAEKCFEICGDKLIINSRPQIAEALGIKNIHLPIAAFNGKNGFKCAGASVHSLEEALKAQTLGADYIIAGHVFKTDCKKDLPPRGIAFIKQITSAVKIPVYAIGGITPETAPFLKNSGIGGICLMSSLMETDTPQRLINYFNNLFCQKMIEVYINNTTPYKDNSNSIEEAVKELGIKFPKT